MSRARDLANGINTLAPLASPDFTGSVDVAGEITSTVSGGSNAVFDKSTGGSIAFKQGGTSTSLIEDLQSSGGIGFYTGTGGSLTKKVEINSSGSITTPNGGSFNGTIGDSITLSQGTWTPTFTNSVGADLATDYGTRKATYTRIGNLVFFNVDINLLSYSSSSGDQLYLSGLPMFGVSPSSTNIENNGHPGGIVSYFNGTSSNFSPSYSIHWILQDTGRINFFYADGSTSSNFQRQWLGSSSRFIFEGKYYLTGIT